METKLTRQQVTNLVPGTYGAFIQWFMRGDEHTHEVFETDDAYEAFEKLSFTVDEDGAVIAVHKCVTLVWDSIDRSWDDGAL